MKIGPSIGIMPTATANRASRMRLVIFLIAEGDKGSMELDEVFDIEIAVEGKRFATQSAASNRGTQDRRKYCVDRAIDL